MKLVKWRQRFLFTGLLATVTIFAVSDNPAISYDREFEQKFKYKRSQHRFKMQEMKRKHEQRRKEFKNSYNSNQNSSSRTPSSRYSRSSTTNARSSRSASSSQQNLIYKSVTDAQRRFNSKSAPRPDLCYLKFVQASKGARSLSQLYPYLPSNSVVKIKQGAEKSIDKQAYFNKKKDYYRQLANNTVNVVDYKVLSRDKSKGYTLAKLEVKFRNTSKRTGKKYKYRNDIIKMIGEGNYWKFKSRQKSSIVHNGKPPKHMRD